MSILSILAAILLLGILITVHEFGHFFFARITGIEVQEYAIGFGPKLIGWTGKSGTKFSLRCFPLGGYCMFYGEDDATGKSVDDPRAFYRQPVWKRMLSVVMGPGLNFLLPLLVLFVYFWCNGALVYQAVIADVTPNGPAYVAGMQVGDVVLSVNGTSVAQDNAATDVTRLVADAGEDKMQLVVLRGEEYVTLEMTAAYNEEVGRPLIGVQIANQALDEIRPIGPGEAMRQSWDSCIYAATSIWQALSNMVTTGEGLNDVGGVVGTVAVVSEQVSTYGFSAFINALALISINLGIMNLLPIPGLDGARLLFLLLEAIRRKPIPQQKEALVNLAGLALLFGLMIFLVFKDVWTLIGR